MNVLISPTGSAKGKSTEASIWATKIHLLTISMLIKYPGCYVFEAFEGEWTYQPVQAVTKPNAPAAMMRFPARAALPA